MSEDNVKEEPEVNPEDEGHFVARCRGLPWSATVDEIVDFFEGCNMLEGSKSVHVTLTREGRPSGEAYIEMASEEDLEKAVKKDRQNMGKRYVEVFKAKYTEMRWVMEKSAGGSGGGSGDDASGDDDFVVRLRGLPFDSSREDVSKFFDGLEITNNGILLTTDYQGRSTGEAFVQFANKECVEKALDKNKQTIGHRYIEVFRSSMEEAFRSYQAGGASGSGGGGGGFPRAGGGGPMAAGPRRNFGPMMGGGGRMRPGPYDRMGGAGGGGGGGGGPMGRGFGPVGPANRGSRSFKSFGGNNYDGGYGGGGSFGRFGGSGGGMGMGGGAGGGNMGAGGSAGGSGGGPRHLVRMRGLPFRVTENDIAEWFSSVADPVAINIEFNNQGRPTGEADVMFYSESDAKKALSKDRQNMQHRYVELFYEGPVGGGGNLGGGGGVMGGGGGFGSMNMGMRGGPMGGGGGGYRNDMGGYQTQGGYGRY